MGLNRYRCEDTEREFWHLTCYTMLWLIITQVSPFCPMVSKNPDYVVLTILNAKIKTRNESS